MALALLAGGSAPAAAQVVPADGSIRVIAKAVPLNPENPRQTRVGRLTYAGGVELSSPDTSRLHGVSGIDVEPDGRTFVAVTDEGDLVQGRLRLTQAGRLVGVEQVTLRPLGGEDGRPLQGKQEADAEDITLLPGGGFAVSFERDHRVLAYAGTKARALFRAGSAKAREMGLSENGGLEALTHDGSGMFAGSEAGAVWAIRGGAATGPNLAPEPPRGFSLTGLDAAAGPDWIGVYRAFSLFGGMRAVIAALPAPRCIRAPCEAPHGLIELARLAAPLTVDNFEGVAATPRPGGGWRFYIVSDDNFSPRQRTLLLAFDWSP
ncbi:MAG TPA: esterase-like activity of phytase family protein [Caulobacteraceae bacterium]